VITSCQWSEARDQTDYSADCSGATLTRRHVFWYTRVMTRDPIGASTVSSARIVLGLLCFFVGGLFILASISVTAAVNVAGGCSPVFLLSENFDNVMPPALPLGWSSTTWVTSDSGLPTPPADTPPNAAFVDDPAMISDKRLHSPSMILWEGSEPVQITFRNSFNMQDGFDGGVLEISIDGGATFQDIQTRAVFVSGGYNGTISSCCGNPLAGRQAWTGNSNGFITTTLDVSVTWGPSMILRWRMGSDSSVSRQGWRIDGVVVTQCHKPVPSATPTPKPTPSPRPRPTPAPRPTPPV
jgi:hypothetical protein